MLMSYSTSSGTPTIQGHWLCAETPCTTWEISKMHWSTIIEPNRMPRSRLGSCKGFFSKVKSNFLPWHWLQEKQGIMDRLARTELAVSNAVGPAASQYFKHLEKFLYRIPSNIMGLPIFQLIKVTESSTKSQQVRLRDGTEDCSA